MAWKMKFLDGKPCWFDWESYNSISDPKEEFKMSLIYKKNLYPDLVNKGLFLIPSDAVGDEKGVYRVLPLESKILKTLLVDNKITGIFRWIKRGENYGLKLIKQL